MLINPNQSERKPRKLLDNLSFNIVKKKQVHIPREYVKGLCVRDPVDEELKIRLKNGKILEFDKNSDVTKGQTIVFSKFFTKFGKPYKIIRTADVATFNPGVQYTLICSDYYYDGYIKNGKFFITKLLDRKTR